MTHSNAKGPSIDRDPARQDKPRRGRSPGNLPKPQVCGGSWAAGPWNDVGAPKHVPAVLAPYPSLGNAEEVRGPHRVNFARRGANPQIVTICLPARPGVKSRRKSGGNMVLVRAAAITRPSCFDRLTMRTVRRDGL